MRYIMEIKPALEPKERHQIQDHLTWLGYHVSGGGTCTDMSSCDISFDKEGAFETMDLRQRWIDEVTILKDKLVKINGLYNELLFAVAKKYPNESRHDPAKRYIQDKERSVDGPAKQAEPGGESNG